MGAPMTLNLMQSNFSVTAWNRSQNSPYLQRIKDAGGLTEVAIAEAVADADYIFVCVSDVPDVRSFAREFWSNSFS